MGKLIDVINNNPDVVKALVKAGKVSSTVVQEKEIYERYSTASGSKMDKYTKTADDMNLCEKTVRRAVKSMESDV